MQFVELMEAISAELAENLPGADAHQLMAPFKRPTAKAIREKSVNARLSATLMLMYPQSDETFFTLIQRPDYDGTHGGQVSFPGGRHEEGESIMETALRETHEEVGVPSTEVNLLGSMTEVYIPPSNFLVQPYVGYCGNKPIFVPDTREVDHIMEIRLKDILRDDIILEMKKTIGERSGNPMKISIPYFELNHKVVWGATAVMLAEMRQLLFNIGLKP